MLYVKVHPPLKPQGNQGDMGEQGIQGEQGETGAERPKGAQGSDGLSGDDVSGIVTEGLKRFLIYRRKIIDGNK